MTSAANKDVVRHYFAALSRNDIAALMDMYAEDMCLRVPGNTCTSVIYTKAQLGELGRHVPEIFPQGLRFIVHGMVAEGDCVAVEAESSGTHVSGQPYNNHYHFLIQLRDGRIVEVREYLDTQLVNDVICGGGMAS